MSEQAPDAAALADDLAHRTAAAVHAKTRETTRDLDFDSEPQSFLVVLDQLADDGQ